MSLDTYILMIDDSPADRDNLRTQLHVLGYTNIIECNDGREGLEKLRLAKQTKNLFDVIFCDWNMPNMTGFDLLRQVRAEFATDKLPFIFVTSKQEAGDVIEAVMAGATNYVE